MLRRSRLLGGLAAATIVLAFSLPVRADHSWCHYYPDGRCPPPGPSEPPLAWYAVRSQGTAHVHFDFDRTTPKGTAELDNVIDSIIGFDPPYGMGRLGYVRQIDAVGHTDSIGSRSYNQGLSARRAAAVQHYMGANGIREAAINAYGMGESQPVASNRTRAGRAQNRRVELHIDALRIP